ncbi:MAG: hypothetical protein GVY29_00920 [Spirochaetes bacterium]|nr:hypothetical protein [Spirochaetota bacterium]
MRTLRSEFTIPPSKKIRFHVSIEQDFEAGDYLVSRVDLIESLTNAEGVTFGVSAGAVDTSGSIAVVGVGFEAYVFVRDVIDVDAEIARLKKSRDKAEKQLSVAAKKLANEGFLSNASQEIIDKEREKHDELSRQVERMSVYLVELER